MTIRAVLFDCDGVLVDSEPAAFDLLGEEMVAAGLVLDEADMHTLFLGSTMAGVAEKARGLGAQLAADWVEQFYERLYARLAEGTPLMPGVEELLDRLDAAGIPYAVGSNGTTRKMRITLGQHARVWPRVKDRLYSGQELGCPKPQPGLYAHAARSLGVEPSQALVLDDSANGCLGGIADGCQVLGFAPSGPPEALARLGVDLVGGMEALAARIGL